jgi:hypothetical protein
LESCKNHTNASSSISLTVGVASLLMFVTLKMASEFAEVGLVVVKESMIATCICCRASVLLLLTAQKSQELIGLINIPVVSVNNYKLVQWPLIRLPWHK